MKPREGLEESILNVIRSRIGKLKVKQFEYLDLEASDFLDCELIVSLLTQDFRCELGRQYGGLTKLNRK
jgi:hypothetical protein